MDRKKLLELENVCIQGFPPRCTAACPVHVGGLLMTKEIGEGNFTSALNSFRQKVYFPRIMSRICDHPCEKKCLRKDADEPISLSLLERACVDYGDGEKNIWKKPFRKKSQKVAVIGGGLSGLAAAFFLSEKGYPVTLFEQKPCLGGQIWQYPEEILPREAIKKDLALLDYFEIEQKRETRIDGEMFAALVDQCDAVYLGTGRAGLSGFFFPDQVNSLTYETKIPGVFAGGSGTRKDQAYSPILSLADGKRAGISIDRFLKKSSLTEAREKEGPYETQLVTRIDHMGKEGKVSPQGRGFTPEEARKEAARCLQCSCMECVKACRYLAAFESYPQKYIREISNNLAIVMGVKTAKRLINSCTYCGLCARVCPTGLDMGFVCDQAREEMVRKGVMPPAVHDFPVQDMLFSNSGQFQLIKHQPGWAKSQYLFFPGCQLAALYPEYIEKIYTFLGEKLTGGVGLFLQCCGAPAFWSGRKELFQASLRELEQKWAGMGSPRIIAACSTCLHVFKKNIPSMGILSLWEIFEQSFDFPDIKEPHPEILSVHDPCTTRDEPQIQDAVRSILHKMGYPFQELSYSKEKTKCCGYGGLVSYANKKIADGMIQERISESDHDYLTYCAVCREYLAQKGKPTYHLLDLIYDQGDQEQAGKKKAGYSQKRENRVRLKKQLLKNLWRESMESLEESQGIEIILDEDVQRNLEERLILISDIKKVIDHGEKTGYKILDPETNHLIAHYQPDLITYWVEYSPGENNVYLVHKAYSHRVQLMEDLKES
ncbi:hypothetical protein DCMF_14110 [Candidatus Formimonas warabiya]|uniref:4Fe-4S ferredoxin-type domain-containing protein n=2 Tax=Formimonas warabiya TaxID=1761012 RepID=A0A3G1KTL8_FORW1|nr:hypothetical protein DCMF_14110 [Candidatus Formimonas warabiya]